MQPAIKFKLPQLGITDKAFNSLSFGQQIDYWRKIREWQATAKSVHISQKRKTTAAAFREFIDIYKPVAYFAKFHNSRDYYDDTFEVFYTTN